MSSALTHGFTFRCSHARPATWQVHLMTFSRTAGTCLRVKRYQILAASRFSVHQVSAVFKAWQQEGSRGWNDALPLIFDTPSPAKVLECEPVQNRRWCSSAKLNLTLILIFAATTSTVCLLCAQECCTNTHASHACCSGNGVIHCGWHGEKC